MSANGSNKPTKLHISTQAVTRLLKEKDYYQKDVEGEKATVARQRAALQEKISGGVTPDENEEYLIDQRVRPWPCHPFIGLVASPPWTDEY